MMLYVYEYAISFSLAFIIAFSATPIAKKVAFTIGAVDVPKDGRRMHKRPMARLGGLAIVAGFLATVLFSLVGNLLGLTSSLVPDRSMLGMFTGAFIILAVGVADDIRPLRATMKLAFQIVAAIVVVGSGTVIVNITNPFSPVGLSRLSPLIAYPLTVVWIAGITNAINLIDGLDGLAAGVSCIASVSLFFVSLGTGDMDTALITAILAGSTLGFLPYNFNPARIFMGDTGATFLGFILGVISIQGTFKSYTVIAIAIPILVLGLPLFDTILAIVRRIRSGRPIMEADRGHFHHKLVDMGLTHRQSVAILYVTSAALGLCAVVLAVNGPISALVLVIAVSVFVIVGARYMTEINIFSFRSKNNAAEQNASSGGICGRLLINKQGHESDKDGKKRKLKIMTVFGTRPDAIKMAPLVKELEKYRETVEPWICVTAQHRQMLDQVLDIFGIVPHFDLNIMQSRQTLEQIVTRSLEGLSEVLEKVKPDMVLVHGDTSTCFVSALAAFYKQICVGHVEAGLRTFDKYSPWPEEMNRKLTGAISDMHFAPTAANKQNLLNEGIRPDAIYVTGNTVIDAMKMTVSDNYEFSSAVLRKVDFTARRVITVTAHRRENLGEPLRNICLALHDIAERYDSVDIVYSLHLNPAVQEMADGILGGHPRIHLVNALDVRELHNLMDRSFFVMTDSGGLQEEAPSLGKPVLVLRKETERPEAVTAGTVKLAGIERDKIVTLAQQLLDDPDEYNRMARAVNPYGDGKASERIVKAILYEYGYSDERPIEF